MTQYSGNAPSGLPVQTVNVADIKLAEEAGPKPFMAFEFSDPVISQAGMVAAHALRDRYNQGDAAFVEAVHSYCRSVGSAYRPNDGRARA